MGGGEVAVSNLINAPVFSNPDYVPQVERETKTVQFKPKDCAISFVDNLKGEQRNRFKKMLDMGIECGEGIAKAYNVPFTEFISEVKAII